jgi:peptidyl-prolyl cis-trans isomerase SurA
MAKSGWFGVVLVALLGLSGGAAAAGRAPAESPPPHSAQNFDIRIAAVVNDDEISVYELNERVKMVMLSSGIADTPEVRQRVAQQVLRTMVDERLQIQEAKRQNISASPKEIKSAIADIAKQNNMSVDQLDTLLKSRGIDRQALVEQVTASIVWSKLVRRKVMEGNPISDEEIDAAMKRLKENAGEPQSRVAEIFLPVDNPQQDDEVRRLAERLTQQMRQGARFSAIARQFSQSPTAAVGGDLGWVRPEELAPELGKELAQLKPGELSPPIRSGAGYYLLLVLDRRSGKPGSAAEDETLHLVQVAFPLPPQASEAARRAAILEAQSVRSAAGTCAALLKIGREKSPRMTSEGHLRIDQIAPGMRKFVLGLPVGKPSEPIVQKNGVGILMVCDKATPQTTMPTREQVADALLRQHVETLARQYLRDLRRAAFVDVRV